MQRIDAEVDNPIGTCLVPTGVDWDAVRVPRHIGLAALQRMPRLLGSVVVDPAARAMYFFTPVNAACEWQLPDVHVLGVRQYLVVPPVHRCRPPGPYWLVTPSVPPQLTEPEVLRKAVAYELEAATDSRSTS